MEDIDAGRLDFSDLVDLNAPPLPPVSPGQMLKEEFLLPMGLSAKRLAAEMGVPTNRITGIINGTRGITAQTAILLARRFGNSARFWMNLQLDYDLRTALALEARLAGC